MSWKKSMVSMAIPAFLQGYQPPGASAYRQNPSSRMPETQLRWPKELLYLEKYCGQRHAGCNTFGQIARGEGQFSGFHNCTAVVCIIPG
jgi:hypothetical protein